MRYKISHRERESRFLYGSRNQEVHRFTVLNERKDRAILARFAEM